MLEKASVAVQSEIGVKHPVMYKTTFAKWHLKTEFHFSRLRCSTRPDGGTQKSHRVGKIPPYFFWVFIE